MAEQAQQEPTMEEILSSIRKIIADDDQGGDDAKSTVSAGVVEVGEAADDAFDDLDLTEALVEAAPATEEDVLEALSEVETDTDVFESISSFDDLADEPALEELEDSFEAAPEIEDMVIIDDSEIQPFEDDNFEETVLAAEPEIMPEPETQFTPPVEEAAMPAARHIADPSTAEAAAGSLGKLLSKVEFGEDAGGNNTIEGVVRDMLRPMLKEWLDDNLPGIVEKQVEAEVQRIARMAR